MKFGKDIVALTRKLLIQRDSYFSNEVLNSEGRKIFEELSRMILDEHPYLKDRIRKVRRKGDLTSFIKLSELILGEEEVKKIIMTTLQYPYTLRGLNVEPIY